MSLSALVHLYRGELHRAVTYRLRLDTTTNWAMTANIAVVTFALGSPQVPHAIMMLPYFLTIVFALVEARRYQELDVLKRRIRLLERGMFAPILREREHTSHWGEMLAESLDNPVFKISLENALANRIRRNYFWLFVTVYVSWLSKLWLLDENVFAAARIEFVPGVAIIIGATLAQIPWIVVAVRYKEDSWV